MFCLPPLSRHCVFLMVLRSTLPSLRMLSGALLRSQAPLSPGSQKAIGKEECLLPYFDMSLLLHPKCVCEPPFHLSFYLGNPWPSPTINSVQSSADGADYSLAPAGAILGQVLLTCASGSSLLGPTSPQRALQKLQVMFSASASLFKQNALSFLVLRSCGMPLPLQPAGSHGFIIHFFAMEETSNSQLAFYPLRDIF